MFEKLRRAVEVAGVPQPPLRRAAARDDDSRRIAQQQLLELRIGGDVREIEVIALVASGRSDGEIADSLVLSKKTASTHVANIKSKLGARTRVEIAVMARNAGLD